MNGSRSNSSNFEFSLCRPMGANMSRFALHAALGPRSMLIWCGKQSYCLDSWLLAHLATDLRWIAPRISLEPGRSSLKPRRRSRALRWPRDAILGHRRCRPTKGLVAFAGSEYEAQTTLSQCLRHSVSSSKQLAAKWPMEPMSVTGAATVILKSRQRKA